MRAIETVRWVVPLAVTLFACGGGTELVGGDADGEDLDALDSDGDEPDAETGADGLPDSGDADSVEAVEADADAADVPAPCDTWIVRLPPDAGTFAGSPTGAVRLTPGFAVAPMATVPFGTLQMMRVDDGGHVAWSRRFDGERSDTWQSPGVAAGPSGEAVFGGSFRAAGDEPAVLRVASVDASGSLLWQIDVGDLGDAFDVDIAAVPGGTLAAASTAVPEAAHDPWLVRLDADGGVVWQRRYFEDPRPDDASGGSALAVGAFGDGSLLVAGIRRTRSPDYIETAYFRVFRIDADGNPIWARELSGCSVLLGGWTQFPRPAVAAMGSGNVAVAWPCAAPPSKPRILFFVVRPDGSVAGSSVLPVDSHALGVRMVATAGGVAIGGETNDGTFATGGWLGVLNEDGSFRWRRRFDPAAFDVVAVASPLARGGSGCILFAVDGDPQSWLGQIGPGGEFDGSCTGLGELEFPAVSAMTYRLDPVGITWEPTTWVAVNSARPLLEDAITEDPVCPE